MPVAMVVSLVGALVMKCVGKLDGRMTVVFRYQRAKVFSSARVKTPTKRRAGYHGRAPSRVPRRIRLVCIVLVGAKGSSVIVAPCPVGGMTALCLRPGSWRRGAMSVMQSGEIRALGITKLRAVPSWASPAVTTAWESQLMMVTRFTGQGSCRFRREQFILLCCQAAIGMMLHHR